jgi:hypothetical protein
VKAAHTAEIAESAAPGKRPRCAPSRAPAAPYARFGAPTVSDPHDKSTSAPGADTAAQGQAPPDEFAHIKRRSRPPVVALGAVALAAFLSFRLREDIVYTLSSSHPQELGDARALAGKPLGELPLNRYVRLSGPPDHESAVILDVQGSWKYGQLFRLRGTSGRFYVRRDEDPLPIDRAERDVFTGRLLPFKDLSFADSIGQHFATHVTGTHFFPAEALAAALPGRGAGPLSLTDLGGDRVTLPPGERLSLDVLRPEQLRIELPRRRFPTEAAARKAVEDQGGHVLAVAAGSGEEPPFVVTASLPPERRERALSVLADLDSNVTIRPARDTINTTLADLEGVPGGLAVRSPAGREVLPLAAIASARTLAPVAVPDNAVLLIEDERPGDRSRSLVILVVLLGFVAANLLALRRPA